MYYKEYGDKDAPLLLFLHGGGVSGWMWEKQVDYFNDYHCVVIDLPAHGKSSHLNDFSIIESAKMTIQFIRTLAGGKKVIAVGFSLGAQVIVQMMSMTKDVVNGAMINSALVRPNPLIKKWIRPTVALTYPLIKNKKFAKLQSKALYISDEKFDAYFIESSNMKAETLTNVLEENMSFQMPDTFKNANATMLVTVGVGENEFMKKSAQDLVNANFNCSGVIVSGVGHGFPLAHPDLFNGMLETWLHKQRFLPLNQ